MLGYGKDSKTCRIWVSGTRIDESRNLTFIETLPVTPNAFEHDHNDNDDDNFLDWEASIPFATQDMPSTEADAESDTGGIQNGGAISNSDEESDSNVDIQPSKAANEKRIARQLRQPGDTTWDLNPLT